MDLPKARVSTFTGRLANGLVARVDEEGADAPVFRRPSPGSAGRAGGGSDEPACGDLGGFPKSSKAIFPLSKDYFGSYEDTWGAPRPQGSHEGTDLMIPTRTPEFAVADGTIAPVSGVNEDGWNRLGGYTVMLKAAYDICPVRKGDLFYYAHMDRKSSLPVGTKVRAGQQIGVVGDAGQGPEVTRDNFPPHLHFGWYDASGARANLESGAMNPYPLLFGSRRTVAPSPAVRTPPTAKRRKTRPSHLRRTALPVPSPTLPARPPTSTQAMAATPDPAPS